ncbi:MAG: chromophore lyase CpcT/CpeT [Hydrococcus sp. Prado102]|jgi:hypothetical protein|nr:chromophore lyase CpcT/CpeT [Hydrococcus sp. Prado102]
MKNIRKISQITLKTLIVWGAFSSFATAQDIPIQQQVNSVVSHLVGVMDTSDQASTNPKTPSVRMTTCRVQITDSPTQAITSAYLYQEQALMDNLDKPYRQRLLQIKPSADDRTVESKSFKLQNPESAIGLCNKPETQRVIQLSNLGEFVCSVFLKPTDKGYFGETPPQGCPANVRGAVKITNTILLHSEGMDTWDRGYDALGNQVWGAEDRSYQYRWVRQGI